MRRSPKKSRKSVYRRKTRRVSNSRRRKRRSSKKRSRKSRRMKMRKSRSRKNSRRRSRSPSRRVKSVKFRFEHDQVWTVYTKEGCPFCKNVIEELNKNHIVFKTKPKENENNKKEVEDKLKALNIEYTTWPRVFDNKGNFIGGYNDTVKYFETRKMTFN